MVGTRQHPKGDFPETPTPPSSSTSSLRSPTNEHRTPSRRAGHVGRRGNTWTHTPSNLTLLWLAISLPLVIWDTGYVLLRPHSMPGGKFHSPIWKPYALYGSVDYMYGWPAWDAHNGFTAAQGLLNLFETIGYGIYLGIVYQQGVEVTSRGRGAPKKLSTSERIAESVKRLARARRVTGGDASMATLLGFSVALLTLFKTVLYWLNEACSDFANIGHNSVGNLILLWIIPNGAWLVFPAYMVYVFGAEILEGLETSSGYASKRA